MVDWRRLAMAAILADGKVDENEIKILKRELFGEGSGEEAMAFLIELRAAAQKKARSRKEEPSPELDKFFYGAVQKHVLKEGKINGQDAQWLRSQLFASGKLDDNEYAFLEKLNKSAKDRAPEFDTMFKEVTEKRQKAAAKAKK